MIKAIDGVDPHHLKVCQKLEAVIALLVEVFSNSSRDHRFLVADPAMRSAWRLHSKLTRAGWVTPKIRAVSEAVVELDVLKAHLRIAYEVGAIPANKRQRIINKIAPIGSDVGGWYMAEEALAKVKKEQKK